MLAWDGWFVLGGSLCLELGIKSAMYSLEHVFDAKLIEQRASLTGEISVWNPAPSTRESPYVSRALQKRESCLGHLYTVVQSLSLLTRSIPETETTGASNPPVMILRVPVTYALGSVQAVDSCAGATTGSLGFPIWCLRYWWYRLSSTSRSWTWIWATYRTIATSEWSTSATTKPSTSELASLTTSIAPWC